MLWPVCSFEGSSDEKTHLPLVSKGIGLDMAPNIQIRRSSVKVQVQSLTANGDGLEISLVILFRAGNHGSIVGSRSFGSGSVDHGGCGGTKFGVLAVGARESNGTGYFLAWELRGALGDGESGGASHIAGPLGCDWVRCCGDNGGKSRSGCDLLEKMHGADGKWINAGSEGEVARLAMDDERVIDTVAL